MKSTSKPTNCKVCQGSKFTKLFGGLFDDRYGAPGLHSVFQCRKCGYSQTIPGISKAQLGKFYAKYYPHGKSNSEIIKKNPTIPNLFFRYLLGLGHTCHWYAKKDQKVLDIGSGTGRSLIELRAIGAKGYGVEPDPSVQKIAKRLNLKVWKGFISDNPFPKQKFDLITASQVIEHDPDPTKFLRQASAKLAKGGTIILSTPNISSLSRIIWKKRWLHWHIPYHLSYFREETFRIMAERQGLVVKKFKTVTPTLWTVLQWEMISVGVSIEGFASGIWTKQNSYIRKLVYYFIAVPYSRLIDLFGYGDSLVIILEKK